MKRLTLLTASLTLSASLATFMAAAPLSAQRTRVYETRPDTVTILDRPWNNEFVRGGFMASNRGIIGVTIDMRPSQSDSVGATLSAVTPGGPAARAGLVAGDIVLRFNGTLLVERGRRGGDDDEVEQSLPGLKLLELASRMTPGDTVTIEWRHERARRTGRIVAEPAATMVFGGGPDVRVYTDQGPGRSGFRMFTGDDHRRVEELRSRLEGMNMPGIGGDQFFFRFGGLAGIQFAPINEDLGRYFGVTEGVLVLETPDTSAHVDLKGGDVIVSVDGRKPSNVEHLHRILASYQGDETVRFEVMRDRRRVNVEAKAEDLRSPRRVMLERRLPSRVPMETPAPEPSRPRQRVRSGT